MRTKISKVAKDLNVGVSTAVEFLRKHNIEVDGGGPNARIDQNAVDLLTKEFSNDKTAKAEAEHYITARRGGRKEKGARVESVGTRRPSGPRILGKIDLDNPGAGIKATTEPAPAVEEKSAAAPEPAKAVAETPAKNEAKPAPAPKPAPEAAAPAKEQPAPAAPAEPSKDAPAANAPAHASSKPLASA